MKDVYNLMMEQFEQNQWSGDPKEYEAYRAWLIEYLKGAER